MAPDPTPSIASPTGPDQTRAALVKAALTLFGSKGFAATSTREIAALARANIGSIAYHFGGKEGLRDACARHIVETIRHVAQPAFAESAAPMGRAEALAQFQSALDRMAGFILSRPEAGLIVHFVLRELSQPSSALDIIYSGVFEPLHKRFCIVWEAATGEPAESDRTRLTVFTLIGQVVYFRIGREAVLRRMGWETVGPAEAAAIVGILKDNIAAILSSRSGDRP